MNDNELKKIAQEILVGVAQGNWDYGLDVNYLALKDEASY